MTIRLSLAAVSVGLLFGLLGASAKVSNNVFARGLGGFYTSVVRGIPETVWVLMIYFGTVSAFNALGAYFGYPRFSLSPCVSVLMPLRFFGVRCSPFRLAKKRQAWRWVCPIGVFSIV